MLLSSELTPIAASAAAMPEAVAFVAPRPLHPQAAMIPGSTSPNAGTLFHVTANAPAHRYSISTFWRAGKRAANLRKCCAPARANSLSPTSWLGLYVYRDRIRLRSPRLPLMRRTVVPIGSAGVAAHLRTPARRVGSNSSVSDA